jgi:hypothetical protein
MRPSAYVILDQIPLTANGKVDRGALPAPGDAEAPAARPGATPGSETERRLAEIWKQVLGIAEVGTGDDIFELGGDSILIFQISTRAARAGLAVTPSQVFRLRTIAAIAAELAAGSSAATGAASIQRVNRDAYRRQL